MTAKRKGEAAVKAVVFDVGNVLVRWDPRFLFSKLLPDAEAVENFLSTVCTQEWNLEQDRGRSWSEAVAERTALFPEHAELIRAYDERWDETIGGEIPGSVAILEALANAGIPLYALTNFSREKFAETRTRFPFFGHFRGIVVSGEEGLVKPDRRIYALIAERYGLEPAATVFIDDSPANVVAAREFGFRAIGFVDADVLRAELEALGLPVTPVAA